MEKYYVLQKDNTIYGPFTYENILYWAKNHILSIGNNWNDKIIDNSRFGWFIVKKYHKCEFIIKDSYWRTIQKEYLTRDINNLKPEKYYKKQFRHEKNWLGFRTGPIPDHSIHWHKRGKTSRSPKTFQEVKNFDEQYSRKRRNKSYLPCSRSYFKKRNSKSWKNTKKEKQWM